MWCFCCCCYLHWNHVKWKNVCFWRQESTCVLTGRSRDECFALKTVCSALFVLLCRDHTVSPGISRQAFLSYFSPQLSSGVNESDGEAKSFFAVAQTHVLRGSSAPPASLSRRCRCRHTSLIAPTPLSTFHLQSPFVQMWLRKLSNISCNSWPAWLSKDWPYSWMFWFLLFFLRGEKNTHCIFYLFIFLLEFITSLTYCIHANQFPMIGPRARKSNTIYSISSRCEQFLL